MSNRTIETFIGAYELCYTHISNSNAGYETQFVEDEFVKPDTVKTELGKL